MKSVNIDLLQPSGPIQTCTWIAWPLPLPVLRSKNQNFRPLIRVEDKEDICEKGALVAPCELRTVHTLDKRSEPLHVLAHIVGVDAYSLMHAAFLYGSFNI
jgi:hypothetical protein